MSRLRLVPPMGILLGTLALSACGTTPQSSQAQADAATRNACQQRAEQAYEQQNRAEIYSPPATVNTPYSANYIPNQSDRGLSDLFAHDRMVSDCVRNTGTNSDRTPPPPGTKP
jgi:hypothetical protein